VYGRFEYITNLQYEVKSLRSQVDGFKSGKKYVKMCADFESRLAGKDRTIRKLERALERMRRQSAKECNFWIQAADNLVDEHAKVLYKFHLVFYSVGYTNLINQVH
jgi:excinuclease UvrABC nuclease subunit